MYQIETVPVPILDENKQVHSYTELKIEKPYIALNKETYITLCMDVSHSVCLYVDQIFSSTEPIFLEIRQAFASF